MRAVAEDELCRTIATSSPDARIVVTGGAGVGKTHILRARLTSLICDHGLSPGTDILTLSFTNAAVDEVRRRLSQSPARVRAAAPVTFDSLASRILSDLDPNGNWPDRDFDGRITEATDALGDADHLGLIAGVQHVVLDEAQDLVDVRARFALTLIERLSAGYTVFGDPAQAIYGFSSSEEKESFIARLEGTIPNDPPLRIRLEGNRRARTEQARAALWAGPLLEAGGEAVHDVLDRLLDVYRDCPELGSASDAAPVLQGATGRTAVLCRTNGEALLVSEALRREATPHRLQLEAEDRPLAPWIAGVFQGWMRSSIQRSTYVERLAEVAPSVDPDETWYGLNYTAGGDGERLEVDRLRRGLRVRRRPDALLVEQKTGLVVSSIHRSKGLEFDLVAVVEPDDRIRDSDNLAEETRVLYVALTRARDDIFRLRRPWASRTVVKGDAGRRRRTGNPPWKTKAVELCAGDFDRSHAPSTELAKRMWSGEFVGEEITLELAEDTKNLGGPRRYAVDCGGEVIGATY